MGSISRYSAIKNFREHFHQKIETHFADLVGLKVMDLTDVGVDYHVSGTAHLSNDTCFNVHYRWANEEESSVRKELVEEDDFTFKEYFDSLIKDNAIVKIEVNGDDRDDEVYLLLYVEGNYNSYLAVPIGFDTESIELRGGIAEELISEEEFDVFINKYYKD